MKKFMVCGSRTITDEKRVFGEIEKCWSENLGSEPVVLVEGEARGVDSIAKAWAISKNFQLEPHKPDWKKFGRGAGIVRNKEMVEASDFVLILWDGASKGTLSDIQFCEKLEKQNKVVMFI